jgi:hypothetical protein
LEAAGDYLKKWYFRVTHSRLEPIIDAAHTVKRHCDGILRWFDSRIANGLIEGLVQAAKARGYRSTRNLNGHDLFGRRKARPRAAGIRRFLSMLNSEEPANEYRQTRCPSADTYDPWN